MTSDHVARLVLELDVGNTRAKWRLLQAVDAGAGDALASGAVNRRDSRPNSTSNVQYGLDLAPIEAAWQGLGRRPLQAIRVASVASHDFDLALAAQLQTQFNQVPGFAHTVRQCAGVRCGYREPMHMGVDRWLALLAAHAREAQDQLVVSAGTAVTLDLLQADGTHLGGYIVPGLWLMQSSLGQGTADVQVRDGRDPVRASIAPGVTTPEAVQHGTLLILVRAIEALASDGRAVVLCGGDAALLAACLPAPSHEVPELVLDGLALSALGPPQPILR